MEQEQAISDGEIDMTLLSACHDGLASFLAERQEVLDLLEGLIATNDGDVAKSASRQRGQLTQLEPSVTLIGQVKAGKTSLVNALIGSPGLLPADVNPWTSVVTSLHLRNDSAPDPNQSPAEIPNGAGPSGARFTFFEPEDWDRLTRKGGRIGELAGRSGAEDEAEKVRAQVEQMREKTRRRLGRKFELLLGTSHEYGSFSKDLIERYVCLGDDDGGTDEGQGRFADITKAADLYVPRPDWPLPLCLRDTPGVNDTFMMREQITISAIRDSRICVVVLSAHQALSSVDMALIRLIANVQSREVIIFVNRVDELADPVAQIDEIRTSIRATLAAQNGPKDAEILFGSAEWATRALLGNLTSLEEDAAETLLSYAQQILPDMGEVASIETLVWHLSGVPALYNAIWERVTEGIGREQLQTVARQAMNMASGLNAAAEADQRRTSSRPSVLPPLADLQHELSLVQDVATEQFVSSFRSVLDTTITRMERSHRSFLDRATAALIHHLETYGEYSPWTYDPTGLRVLLRSGYQVFARQARSAADEAGAVAVNGIGKIYGRAFDCDPGRFEVKPPLVPKLAPPVLLGQTIALDLKGTWWRRWWSRRRGYSAFAEEFYGMIESETAPIVNALVDTHCRPTEDAWRTSFEEFFDDQRVVLSNLSNPSHTPGGPKHGTGLRSTVERLGRHAA